MTETTSILLGMLLDVWRWLSSQDPLYAGRLLIDPTCDRRLLLSVIREAWKQQGIAL
jgi:hypothetical protein